MTCLSKKPIISELVGTTPGVLINFMIFFNFCEMSDASTDEVGEVVGSLIVTGKPSTEPSSSSDQIKTQDSLNSELKTLNETVVIHDTRNCVVCCHLNSSYKCPLCYSRYCSIDCYQSHRRSCNEHSSKKNLIVTTTPVNQTTDITIIKALTDDGTQQHTSVDGSTRPDTNSAITTNNDDNGEQLLDQAHKDKMMSSKHLRSLLRSKRLRADIANIDASTDRQETLKSLRSKNKEFEAFIDVLLKVVKSPDK